MNDGAEGGFMKKTERCPWAYGASPLYILYHDREWGWTYPAVNLVLEDI